MKKSVVLVVFLLAIQVIYADSDPQDYKQYEDDDDYPEEFNLDPNSSLNEDLNEIDDENRQVIFNPRKRRQRRRQHQGK